MSETPNWSWSHHLQGLDHTGSGQLIADFVVAAGGCPVTLLAARLGAQLGRGLTAGEGRDRERERERERQRERGRERESALMVLDFEHFSMPKSEGRRDVYGSCGGVMFCHVFFIEFFFYGC